MSPPLTLSPAPSPVDGGGPNELPLFRKIVLLVLFCLAQSLSYYNGPSLYSALLEAAVAEHSETAQRGKVREPMDCRRKR